MNFAIDDVSITIAWLVFTHWILIAFINLMPKNGLLKNLNYVFSLNFKNIIIMKYDICHMRYDRAWCLIDAMHVEYVQ